MKKTLSSSISVRFDDATHTGLDEMAKATGLKASDIIRLAVVDKINRLNAEDAHLASAPKSSSAAVAAAALGSESGKENIITTSPATATVDMTEFNKDLRLIGFAALVLFITSLHSLIRPHITISPTVETAIALAIIMLTVMLVIYAARIWWKRVFRSLFPAVSHKGSAS
jgi:predicted DNA-binding protein